MKLVIVGCGYLGQRVALLARRDGMEVTALTRSGTSGPLLAASGVTIRALDLDRPQILAPPATGQATILYLAPPPDQGLTDPRVEAWCAAMESAGLPAKLVYLSTTGVYGDCGGALVDETAPPHPATDRARRRLAAERTLREWSGRTGVPLAILRVAGIYGPGRLPLAALRAGQPVLNRSEAPCSNRIHVDDLAAVCLAAARRAPAGALYNVNDGESSTLTDFYLAVAEAFGLPAPPQISLAEARQVLSPLLLSYLAESRRIDNRRLLAELGVTLRYPDLRSGLAACREHGYTFND